MGEPSNVFEIAGIHINDISSNIAQCFQKIENDANIYSICKIIQLIIEDLYKNKHKKSVALSNRILNLQELKNRPNDKCLYIVEKEIASINITNEPPKHFLDVVFLMKREKIIYRKKLARFTLSPSEKCYQHTNSVTMCGQHRYVSSCSNSDRDEHLETMNETIAYIDSHVSHPFQNYSRIINHILVQIY